MAESMADSIAESMTESVTDIRGTRRGKCSVCSCRGYRRENRKIPCTVCRHPPAKHENLDRVETDGARDSGPGVSTISTPRNGGLHTATDDEISLSTSDLCALHPKCKSSAYFDVNTGVSSRFCEKHKDCHPQEPGLNPDGLLPISGTCKLPNCNKPCYVDIHTGVVYDCCSKEHGITYLRMSQKQLFDSGQLPVATTIPADMNCTSPFCNKPKYQQANGHLFDFCGQTCRNNYYALKQQSTQGAAGHPAGLVKQCLLPGCKLPRYFDPRTNSSLMFCGNNHKTQAATSVLLGLTSDQKYYKKTVSYFIRQWSTKKSAPPAEKDIVAVFKIFNPTQKQKFLQYAKKLSSSAIEKYFHGTSIKCNVSKQNAACSDHNCGVCGISRKGFDTSRIGSNIPRFKRFGKGFYLAPNSSKCHDYTQGIVDYRVMLLCEVASGNKYTVKNDQTKLSGPPQGYDSVYGASGGSLNYDEIVLYCGESILPKYAIVYRRDGIGKIAQ